MKLHPGEGPISLIFFYHNSNSMEISFCCNSISENHIATNIFICHDSSAVVSCVKFCCNRNVKNKTFGKKIVREMGLWFIFYGIYCQMGPWLIFCGIYRETGPWLIFWGIYSEMGPWLIFNGMYSEMGPWFIFYGMYPEMGP